MLDEALLDLIVVLHFIFVMFVVITPFLGNNYFLILHAITVPFMMAHWYMNDNNCALTLMEKKIRHAVNGEEPDPNDCFTYNLIAPVYDFKKNNHSYSVFIYLITICLWSYTLYRLYDNWQNGKLQRLEHIIMY
jgi:uncharacterized protein DUF2784